jgi:hypothetical protein
MLNLKNYTRTSKLVPLLNSNALDGWDIYSAWMMGETPRKYTKPAYTKTNLKGDPSLDGKVTYRTTEGRWKLLIETGSAR